MDEGLVGLFLLSFLAATLLPIGCEALFTALVLRGQYPIIECFGVAVIGNTLGSFLTFMLGEFGEPKWLGIKQEHIEKHRKKIERYGPLMGLIGWVPVIGDPIVFSMGLMKTSRMLSFWWIFTGKAARFLFLSLVLREIV